MSVPWSPPGRSGSSLKTPPKPPYAGAGLGARCRCRRSRRRRTRGTRCPGRNRPFSGRLNGVPPLALAARVGVERRRAVDVGVVDRDPLGVERRCRRCADPSSRRRGCRRRPGRRGTRSAAPVPQRERPAAPAACRWSRSLGCVGTKRKTKLLGCLACVFAGAGRPPMSSTIQTLPSESFWMPSYPPRPSTPEMSSTVGREVERRLPGRRPRAPLLGGEEQALRERIPGRAVDGRQRRAVGVGRRQQRHAVGGIGVEVDAGDVARPFPRLVALEQEVRAVVVARVGARAGRRSTR